LLSFFFCHLDQEIASVLIDLLFLFAKEFVFQCVRFRVFQIKNKKIAVDFMEIFMIDFEMFVNRFERNKCRPLECCFR
jgi:hypothetical protein